MHAPHRFARFALTGPALSLLTLLACSENGSGVNAPGSAGTSGAGTPGVAGTSGASGAGATVTGGSSSAAGSSTSGSAGAGGVVGAAGSAAAGSSAGGSGGASAAGASGAAGSAGAAPTERFSFFITSIVAIRRESGSMDGFGGDLGGLAGADALCTTIAERSMPGSGAKGWRAFLSTTTVNAISRIGAGPWYDRAGRVVAMNVDGLKTTRPQSDDAIADDLPNEDGVPNRSGDNHDILTASNAEGQWDGGSTCDDWTSSVRGEEGPRLGHSWPAQSGNGWIQAHTALSCAPAVNLVQGGFGNTNGVGSYGGYGGIYCFALQP